MSLLQRRLLDKIRGTFPKSKLLPDHVLSYDCIPLDLGQSKCDEESTTAPLVSLSA